MADSFASAAGFVQFPVEADELPSGQKVRRATIRTLGTDGVLIRVTLWPEFDGAEVKEGDFLAVDGKYEERVAQNKEGQSRTYRNLNPSRIAVTPAFDKPEREVVNKGGKSNF